MKKDEVADGVRFAFLTGWRRGEVFSLTWSQLDRSGGLVRLESGMTKNGEGRAFPLTPPLRALLERRHEYTRRCERTQACIIPLVFHRKGRPVNSFKRTWAERARRPDCQDCCSTTCGAVRSETSSVRACRDLWR